MAAVALSLLAHARFCFYIILVSLHAAAFCQLSTLRSSCTQSLMAAFAFSLLAHSLFQQNSLFAVPTHGLLQQS